MESHCKKNEGSTLFLLKFIEEEHLGAFLDGNIFTNNFDFFQKLEAKYGKKGIGDANDGCLPIYKLQNLIFQDRETNKVIMTIPELPLLRLSVPEDSKTPIFCLYKMLLEDFKVLEDSKSKLRLLMGFNDEKREVMKNEFEGKTHVVLLEPLLFLERLQNACINNGLNIVHDDVTYYEKGVNDEKRLNDFNKGLVDKYFWKDNSFENQREYRFVFTNKLIDKGENIVNIGDIRSISAYMTIDELLNKEYELVYSFKK